MIATVVCYGTFVLAGLVASLLIGCTVGQFIRRARIADEAAERRFVDRPFTTVRRGTHAIRVRR